jgi:hypothetical protein
MSWMVGSRPLSALKSRSQALISARRAVASMGVGDDDDQRGWDRCRNEMGGSVEGDGQSLEEAVRLSLSPPVPSYRSFFT